MIIIPWQFRNTNNTCSESSLKYDEMSKQIFNVLEKAKKENK